MERTAEGLRLLTPIISEICQILGSADISIGVAYHGGVIHRLNLGDRGVERENPPDSDTVYPIASLTKTMLAAAFGVLVDEGKVSCNSLIRNIYPEFRQASKAARAQATLIDLLAHRIGLTPKNTY